MVKNYILFAIVSTILNLISQFLFLFFYDGFLKLYFAILIGTLSGLICKYILDKVYIFKFKSADKINEVKTFISYSLTGVFTTLIFWGTEIFFDLIFKYDFAKYIGAIVGLTIGYIIKFILDKKFVFNIKQNNNEV